MAGEGERVRGRGGEKRQWRGELLLRGEARRRREGRREGGREGGRGR